MRAGRLCHAHAGCVNAGGKECAVMGGRHVCAARQQSEPRALALALALLLLLLLLLLP